MYIYSFTTFKYIHNSKIENDLKIGWTKINHLNICENILNNQHYNLLLWSKFILRIVTDIKYNYLSNIKIN